MTLFFFKNKLNLILFKPNLFSNNISQKNIFKEIIKMKRIAAFIIIGVMFLACKKKNEKIHPLRENISESVYASGIIKSRNQYEVYSPVNGILLQKNITEGDTVLEDQILMTVKSDVANLNLENARLAADNAAVKSNLDKLSEIKATIDQLRSKKKSDSLLFERQQNLWKAQIGSQIELEQRDLAYKTSLSAYEAALAKYNDTEKQIKFSAAQSSNNLQLSKSLANDFSIKSKIKGKVYSFLKDPGEMVNTQSPLAIIGDANEFIIELQVDEYDIGKVKNGQKVLLTMDSYKNNVYEAEISRIIPFMNERTRTFTLEAIFLKKPPALYPNLTVEANIVIQSKENIITIPREYLTNDSLVTLSSGKEVKVITGLIDYQKVEIVSGLSTDEFIIKPNQ